MAPPYSVSFPDGGLPLRQCEILTNVARVRVTLESVGQPELGVAVVQTRFALVLTQDCDLEQDHRVRFTEPKPESDKLLPEILLAEVYTAQEIFDRIANNNKKQWERLNIEKNKNERFHFLQKVEPGSDRLYEGLPELVIDFKRYFTLPTDELYRRIELGEALRRCVLSSPYLEHLSTRFACYLSRIALPSEHASE